MLYPSNRLKEGLNAHVRNAFSHERYRVLDGERVEMWDEDPRGRRTWDPEVWALDRLEALCQRLYLTSLGVVAALVLFGINYRQLFADIVVDAHALGDEADSQYRNMNNGRFECSSPN